MTFFPNMIGLTFHLLNNYWVCIWLLASFYFLRELISFLFDFVRGCLCLPKRQSGTKRKTLSRRRVVRPQSLLFPLSLLCWLWACTHVQQLSCAVNHVGSSHGQANRYKFSKINYHSIGWPDEYILEISKVCTNLIPFFPFWDSLMFFPLSSPSPFL